MSKFATSGRQASLLAPDLRFPGLSRIASETVEKARAASASCRRGPVPGNRSAASSKRAPHRPNEATAAATEALVAGCG
jgi:hypothetical protein